MWTSFFFCNSSGVLLEEFWSYLNFYFYLESKEEYCLLLSSLDKGIGLMLVGVRYPDNDAAACHGYSREELPPLLVQVGWLNA